MARNARDGIDEVLRDLDLVVFRLERPESDPKRLEAERAAVRRELERLRDTLRDVSELLG